MSKYKPSMPFPADPLESRRVPKAVARFLRNRHRRGDLDMMPDHLLKDVGLTRLDAKFTKPWYRFF